MRPVIILWAEQTRTHAHRWTPYGFAAVNGSQLTLPSHVDHFAVINTSPNRARLDLEGRSANDLIYGLGSILELDVDLSTDKQLELRESETANPFATLTLTKEPDGG